MELGPFRVDKDGANLLRNEYAWNTCKFYYIQIIKERWGSLPISKLTNKGKMCSGKRSFP